MSGKGLTNAGAGKALLYTRVMLEFHALRLAFIVGAIPVLLLPTIWWFWHATPTEYDLVKIDIVSRYVDSGTPRRWYIRNTYGDRCVVVAKVGDATRTDILTPPQLKVALGAKWGTVDIFYAVIHRSIWLAPAVAICMWAFMYWYGRRSQRNRRIRGAQEIVSAKELSARVKSDGASPYTFVGVRLPARAPMRGILAMGAQGSGKSLAIHDLMRQVFARKKKCIIYDQSGEFFRAYFRPGKDCFFNPALLGSVPWSIFSELKYTYDSNTLARAFLPLKEGIGSGQNAFFEDAARALFSVILLRLAQRGAKHTADIARAFLEMPEDEMEYLIEKSVASSAVGGDSKGQRQGVISSIAIYLDGIAAVQPGTWSITDFIESDDDARLFLLNTDDTCAMFEPLYRLMLSISFSVIAARQEIVHEDRYWYFGDEIHSIGDIKLDEQLATKRKNGICIVGGIQSESQFLSLMGKNRGETVMNGFNTILQLRMNEIEMLNRAAQRIGESEVEDVTINQQLGVAAWRDGASLQFIDKSKKQVLASDIGELGECQGFLRIAGPYPVARVAYGHWLRRRLFGLLPARIAQFAERQANPQRNPDFRITPVDDTESEADILAKVSADAFARKQAVQAETAHEFGVTGVKMEGAEEGHAPLDAAPLGNGLSSIELDTSRVVELREIS